MIPGSGEPSRRLRLEDVGASYQQLPNQAKFKTWNPRFFETQQTQDRSFVESLENSNVKRDLLLAFLEPAVASGKSWKVKQVVRFFKETIPCAEARVWVHGMDEDSRKWLTSTDLQHMSRFTSIPAAKPNLQRQLIFVPYLTSNIITAMIQTASWNEAQSLREAVCQHIASKISIRVFVPSFTPPTFQLELHLPFLFLKKCPSDGDEAEQKPHNKKLWSDLSFLPLRNEPKQHTGKYSIYEAQCTVLVSGSNHSDWHGYAFGHSGPQDPIEDEYETNPDDPDDLTAEEGEEGSDDWAFASLEDFFATGGCNPVSFGPAIVDPRIYFLRATQYRLEVVIRAHEYLVRTLEAGVEVWETKNLPDGAAVPDFELQRSLNCIRKMTKLFRKLRERFNNAKVAWSRFSGHAGDILYFADLTCGHSQDALHKIEECFETWGDLERTLARLQDTCSDSADMLQLCFSSENHGMNRTMTGINAQVVELTKSAAESASKSLEAAEDTSRSTRVNVQLLTVTTAIVIALTYFCADRSLFAFERNQRTFWASIGVLVPALLVLTMALHAFDQYKDSFMRRLNGKMKRFATPSAIPVVVRKLSALIRNVRYSTR